MLQAVLSPRLKRVSIEERQIHFTYFVLGVLFERETKDSWLADHKCWIPCHRQEAPAHRDLLSCGLTGRDSLWSVIRVRVCVCVLGGGGGGGESNE